MTKERILKQRMCVVCRKRKDKQDFVRVVRKPTGEYIIDDTYKSAGRGAYICLNNDCISTAINKKYLNKTFKCNVPYDIYKAIARKNII